MDITENFKEKIILASNAIHRGDPLNDIMNKYDIHFLINEVAKDIEAENEQGQSSGRGESWACPSCGGVHDNIDEYYRFCQFCGSPRG